MYILQSYFDYITNAAIGLEKRRQLEKKSRIPYYVSYYIIRRNVLYQSFPFSFMLLLLILPAFNKETRKLQTLEHNS